MPIAFRVQEVILLLRRAIALDPGYAMAYAVLASASWLILSGMFLRIEVGQHCLQSGAAD